MRLLPALFLALLLAFPAQARLKTGPIDAGSGHRIKSATVVDTMATSLIEAYSFRKVRPAYGGPLVKLRRASDNALLDIPTTSSGDLDTSVAATHCAATTCYLNTVYDQSGGSRHLVQTSLPDQPLYVADCGNGRPCMRLDATDWMPGTGATVTPATGVMSISGVGKRSAGTGGVTLLQPAGGGNLSFFTAANGGLMLFSASTFIQAPGADNAWHAGVGTIAGASSVFQMDGGAAVNGTVTLAGTAGSPIMGSAAGTAYDWVEAAAWDNYTLTLAERTALAQNQREYWFPLPLDSFAPSEAYSFRKLKSSYAGPGIKLRRASDNATQDINFLGFTGFTGAPIDMAQAAAFCASTTCALDTVYDQSGNARHLQQATVANQPLYVASCQNGLPCARFDGVNDSMATFPVLVTPATGTMTFAGVAKRTGSGGIPAVFTLGGGGGMYFSDTGTGMMLFKGGPIYASPPPAEGAWHSAVGVQNGASSSLTVDGTQTNGSLVASAVADYPAIGQSTAMDWVEGLRWDNYVLTAAERVFVTNNQRAFWGF